jgi:hypothetical protein
MNPSIHGAAATASAVSSSTVPFSPPAPNTDTALPLKNVVVLNSSNTAVASAKPNDMKRNAEEQRILDDINLLAKKIDSEPVDMVVLSRYLKIAPIKNSDYFDDKGINLSAKGEAVLQKIYTALVQQGTISSLNRPNIVSLGASIITESNRIYIDHYFRDYWGPSNPSLTDKNIDKVMAMPLTQLIIAHNILGKLANKEHDKVDPALSIGVKALIIAHFCKPSLLMEMGGNSRDAELFSRYAPPPVHVPIQSSEMKNRAERVQIFNDEPPQLLSLGARSGVIRTQTPRAVPNEVGGLSFLPQWMAAQRAREQYDLVRAIQASVVGFAGPQNLNEEDQLQEAIRRSLEQP